jgi:CDP-diacylglycerol--serine O-phosphatidyltransferase
MPFLMLLVAMLMMSTVRYPSGKNVDMMTQTKMRPFLGILTSIGLVLLFKEVAVLGLCLAYIFFGLFRHFRRSRRPGAEPATPPPATL